MSIDHITAKIVSDATEYANGLIAEAKAEAEGITAKANQEAEEIKKQTAALSANDAVTLRHRKQSAAELETRKMRLATKQKAVADAVLAAVDHLAGMEQEPYMWFLARTIAEIGVKEGQLVLNAKDKKAIGAQLVKEVNRMMDGGKLVLSDQTMSAKGGFVLKYGALEINSSLESMVHSLKEDVTPEIVTVLFQKQEEKYEKI